MILIKSILFVGMFLHISCTGTQDSNNANSSTVEQKDSLVISDSINYQLGDIGDLFGGGPVGDPPITKNFSDIDKWNKGVATNDEKLIEDINIPLFYLNTGDQVRITDIQDSKWGKAIEFRVLNGEHAGKIGWGRMKDFRLIKSKAQQDEDDFEKGE